MGMYAISSYRGINGDIKYKFWSQFNLCAHPRPLLSCDLGTLTVENPSYLNCKTGVIIVATSNEMARPKHITAPGVSARQLLVPMLAVP